MKRLIIILFLVILIVGIVSADTLTVNVTTDVNMDYYGNKTFAQIKAMTASNGLTANPAYGQPLIQSNTMSPQFMDIVREAMTFNTSSLPDDATITNVTLVLYGYDRSNGLKVGGVSGGLSVVSFTPASNTSIVNNDWDNTDFTRYTSDMPYANWNSSYTVSKENNLYFNSLGISNVSKTSYTRVMLSHSFDVDNTEPTWASWASAYIRPHGKGGLYPAQLIIVYTTGAAPVSSFTIQKPLYTLPKSIQVNDTSTNIPTQWNWSWGDGTWTNGTTQNATHKYTTRGLKSILLVTSNAIGANTTPTASTVRIVGYENYW